MSEFIFAYGHLKIGYDGQPKNLLSWSNDEVKGDLYELFHNQDAAAVNIGKSDNWIKGQVLEITDKEMKKIDKEEMPDFHRVYVMTRKYKMVWAYEYNGKHITSYSKKIQEWTGKK